MNLSRSAGGSHFFVVEFSESSRNQYPMKYEYQDQVELCNVKPTRHVNPFVPIKRRRHNRWTKVVQKWDFVSFLFVHSGGWYSQCLSPPPIDLSRNSAPEHLIEHNICLPNMSQVWFRKQRHRLTR